MNTSVSAESGQLDVRFSTHDDIPRVFYKEIPIIYMLVGVVLNVLLLYYLISARKYRSPIFMLVTSLAISDVMSCLFSASWAAFLWPVLDGPAEMYTLTCKVCDYAGKVSATASCHHLVMFAAIRFYQLCFPLKALVRITATFVRNGCLIIWTAVLLAFLPTIYYNYPHEVLYNGERGMLCDFNGSTPNSYIAFFAVNTVYPGITIPLLHILKYIRVSLAGKKFFQQERKNADARAVTIVILLFYICWIPVNTYQLAYLLPDGHYVYQDKAFLVILYIMSSNSTLNPVVYCLAAQTVREDIKSYVKKGRKIG